VLDEVALREMLLGEFEDERYNKGSFKELIKNEEVLSTIYKNLKAFGKK